MTEEEFLMSLPQSLNPNEKLKRLEQWRQENPQPEVEEEVEEVVEEKPMKLTFESATEPIEQEEKPEEDKPIPLTIASATEPIEPKINFEDFDFETSEKNINKLEVDLIQLSGGDMKIETVAKALKFVLRTELQHGLTEIPRPVLVGDSGIVESVQNVFENRKNVKGLKMTYEPKYLRFFQARFEPLA